MDLQSVLNSFNTAAPDQAPAVSAFAVTKPLVNNTNATLLNSSGHLLLAERFMPPAASMTSEQVKLGESLTDAYAALSCLKELGLQKARADLDLLSFGRAFEFIQAGAGEDATLSTIALDHLAMDAPSLHIERLTSKDMLAIAESYVRKTALNEDEAFDTYCNFIDFKRAFKAFSGTNLEPLKELAEITLLTLPDSAAFHAGARVLDGFLTSRPNLLTTYYIDKTLCSGDEWDEIKKKLKDRTGFLSENHALRQALSNKPTAPAAQMGLGISQEPMGPR